MPDLPAPSPLRPWRPDVWIKESWVRFAGMTLQTRMVVLRLGDGLLLYSPSPATLDPATRQELAALGEVRWLVAPNEIHNLGLRSFQEAYPQGHTTGCLGHPRRVRGVRFDVLLDEHSPPDAVPWTGSGELRMHVIGGNSALHEIAVLHAPSGTLVLTDAVEIISDVYLAGRHPGAAMRWFLGVSGLRLGEPCMSPEHALCCIDPEALDASRQVLESWEFSSLVIAHGELREGEAARAALHDAFTANIAHARARGPLTRSFWSLLSRTM